MYSSTDLSIIYDPYFTVLDLTEDQCEIQSNNTGHCWHLSQNRDGSVTLLHKHHMKDPYHYQTSVLSIEDCLLEIVNHDEYQLRGRKPARFKPRYSFFDVILKAYQRI